jgi:dienelactone hydrolase
MLCRNYTCSPTEKPPEQHYKSLVSRQLTNGGGTITVEEFPFKWSGYTYISHIAYQKGKEPKPLVIVWPNYAGEKQFDIDQAVFLAKCGYAAVSVDMYKETPYENQIKYLKSDRNPKKTDDRSKVMEHFKGAFTAYNWWQLRPKQWRDFQTKFLSSVRTHPAVHDRLAAAIGYCFGGQCCLEQVRAGDDIQGIVSFHGVLQSDPMVNEEAPWAAGRRRRQLQPHEMADDSKFNSKCTILIENGILDDHVDTTARQRFAAEMFAHGCKNVQFHDHYNAEHGFALAPGVISTKYEELSDRRSTISMLLMFQELWGKYGYYPTVAKDEVNACGTKIGKYWCTSSKSKL